MRIINEFNNQEWNRFILSFEHSCFLQSWEWGEFENKSGLKIKRMAVGEPGNIKASALLIIRELGLGKKYLYSPRGPLFKDKESLGCLLIEIANYAKEKNCIFYRLEPESTSWFKGLKKTIDLQPKKTILLNLRLSEDELLKDMHQKTRYNIRLAGRKGVIASETDVSDFEIFWKLMQATVERDGFRSHSKGHYERLIDFDKKTIRFFRAKYEGRIIAVSIVSFFGDTATYLHGGSANIHRHVMAPYILQWQAIKTAKKEGCKFYDLYGVDEKKWPGVTRFKRGFGGKEVKNSGTYDLAYSAFMYYLYKQARIVRRWLWM
ncbi:peptidoglycan bridge formation glycyltransferase FemA/FemB family protein [bacterium]|nr:peptidoglycan bridge formation glycyltransferase FemA/FemB family protein [bacterium]